jgi:alkylation response protein AidB-like acyl-CoA dehydrogenase
MQAMWLLVWRLSALHEAGQMSHEQASLVKANVTLRGREVVALGREILGGNGLPPSRTVLLMLSHINSAHRHSIERFPLILACKFCTPQSYTIDGGVL